jgi:hypothetical protein
VEQNESEFVMNKFVVFSAVCCSLLFLLCRDRVDDFIDSSEQTIYRYESLEKNGKVTLNDINSLNRDILDFRENKERIQKSGMSDNQKTKLGFISNRYEKIALRLSQNLKFSY